MAKQLKEKKYREPRRVFESSGVVDPEESYFVPLENVTNTYKQDIKTMIDRGRYFSIFAPRQSGKTTFFKEFIRQLHADPTYAAITLSFQDYKNLESPVFYRLVRRNLCGQLVNRLREVGCEKQDAVERLLNTHEITDHIAFRLLFEELNQLLRFKKIVIFIDEFDGIPLPELENFLSALRSLYQDYKGVKQKALYSVGLVGIRNITRLVVGGVSPFNIADQVSLRPFTLENIRSLYAQYTGETNQPFTEDAVRRVYEETSGQPWLVNRLGSILTLDVKPETTEPIDEEDVEGALEMLLAEKNDHFDNLYEKAKLYRETFVEIVFDHVVYSSYDEEQAWLEQYGLIKKQEKSAVVANNIYKNFHTRAFFREVITEGDWSPREYVLPGNRLDMDHVLRNFDKYITRIGAGAFYQTKKPYEKTGQFLLTAWLYQFAGGDGDDLRAEVVSGLGRMDILLTHKGRKYIIETKVNRQQDVGSVVEEGIAQLSGKYLASEGITEGYLVIFDTRLPVGTECKRHEHKVDSHGVTSFIIAIGRP